uniref:BRASSINOSTEROID INSENSITIVE 1-associated receptor kinase 1 n=1 Tax=Rhizophora mucronata TaxID=61149 RepID=A0A2P2KHI5_RHIMU
MRRRVRAICFVTFLWFWATAHGLLSPKGVNFEGN